ncbi:MAG: hypothetical protein E6296_06620 [Anaerococcus vaginalis]|nr:hypothetical protein [Anaerococcus vaginalis]
MSDSKRQNYLTFIMLYYVFFDRYGWKDYAFCILLAFLYSFINFELVYEDLKMRIKRITRWKNENKY